MSLKIAFAPVDQMTAELYAQRLRVAAALGDQVTLSMTPAAARSLAADLERICQNAEVVMAKEIARIEAETAAAVHSRAMKLVADRMAEAGREIEAMQRDVRSRALRVGFALLSAALMVAVLVWG